MQVAQSQLRGNGCHDGCSFELEMHGHHQLAFNVAAWIGEVGTIIIKVLLMYTSPHMGPLENAS